MGCLLSSTRTEYHYSMKVNTEFDDEVSLLSLSNVLEDCYGIFRRRSMMIKKNNSCYESLMEALEKKGNIYELETERQIKIDGMGTMHKVEYLVSFKVVNKDPVLVVVSSVEKDTTYNYRLYLSGNVDGNYFHHSIVYSHTISTPGVYLVSWTSNRKCALLNKV